VKSLKSHWRIAFALVAILILAGLVLGACGSSSSSSSSSNTTSQGTPKPGGTYNFAIGSEPISIEPLNTQESEGANVEHQIFQGLYVLQLQSDGVTTKAVPDLAEKTVMSADATVFTFTIKKGVMFAPPVSREVTAQDFVYSFQRMMSLPTAPAKGYYTGIVGLQAFLDGKAKTITGYKATGKYTLEVDLQKPIADFLSIMEMPFSAPVAKEWVAKWGSQVGRHPLGTGPYVLSHWVASQDLLMVRNTNYTGTAGNVDAIHFQFSIQPSTAVLKVQSGDADLLGDYIPPANYPGLIASPQWKSQVVAEPAIALDYLFLNRTVKPFDNLLVRQAIAWSIDRTKIVKLLSGTGQALDQIYPAGLPGHVDGTAGQFYGYDKAKAKQLLTQAGYPNGFSMTLYTHNVEPWPTVAQSIQYDLGQIGIKASLKQLDRPAYWTLIGKKGVVGAGLNDWWMDYPDPFDYIISLFSKSSAIDEGTNPSFWWDPKVETALTSAQVMMDPVARLAKFQDIQSYIMGQAPAVPLYQELVTTLHSKRTGGVYMHPVWIFDYAHYWINK
jgi:peptide/nickel transport system substrate-binding protein/oligopeptide transport system substrate-binding protein